MQPCPILLNWYTYFLGFLVTREDPASYGSREQRELQLRHLGWVRLTIGKGRFRVAGPIMDGSGLGGATIITAEPVAAAEFGEKLTLQSKRVTSTSVRIPLSGPISGTFAWDAVQSVVVAIKTASQPRGASRGQRARQDYGEDAFAFAASESW